MGARKRGRPMAVAKQAGPVRTASQATAYWAERATASLKAGMVARGWGYRELSAALAVEGFRTSPAVLNRRINRGNFAAGFLLACLAVLDTPAPPAAAG